MLGVDHNGPAAAAGLKPTRRGGFLSALQLVSHSVCQLRRSPAVLHIHLLSTSTCACMHMSRHCIFRCVTIPSCTPNHSCPPKMLDSFIRRSSATSQGDVITALNGRPIRAQRDLFAALDEARVGDVVEVTVRSGSGEKTVKVKLADRSKLAAYG